jgi:hypothetical protein
MSANKESINRFVFQFITVFACRREKLKKKMKKTFEITGGKQYKK